MQWLGVILGAVLLVAAVFYFLAGFFPRSGVGQRMRSRLELTADVRRARGYALNTPAIYAWLLRTKPRVAVLVLFLMFWGGWFIWAGVQTS